MSRHSLKEWVAATRYWSFPVSSMPVFATYAYLFSKGLVPLEWRSLLVFLLSVLGVIVLHSAGNLLSDWADYRSGVDNEQAYAVPNLVFGHFRPEEYLRMSIVLFVLGCLIGAGVVLLSGPAGIKTFAMLLGAKVSSILYRIYMVLPFICIIVSVCVGWLHPLALICLIAAVPG